MSTFIKHILCRKYIIPYQECRRYAGHSKWANIRHTKAAKDGQKASALMLVLRKMRIAIAEGKSSKPDENPKLARVIEAAKDASLPMNTIRNALEKMQASKGGTQSVVVESRGPCGCVLLIHALTENVALSRQQFNTPLRKAGFSPNELAKEGTFFKKGIIVAEADNRNIDKVTDDAIDVGAEEVEKIQVDDREYFQFSCHESEMYKIYKKLKDLDYKIVRSDIEYIPQQFADLSDEDIEIVSKLVDKLEDREDVAKVYTNIS
ncbi:hypothetical protein QAD02_006766 [Eretmocerus hayati]|uniref:Uncharacterized protein n=1 Tax=Eretmocerus hayati TaxID=131215 RepID=A0ACC2N469_9HYME|nr:hypothetical protein QAD02_006766 [Eretmocerus hayati]